MDFLENKFFLLALTFAFFFGAKELQKKTGFILLNPILVTIALLIVFLQFTGISYETYEEGGYLIEFWLKPAVVALACLFICNSKPSRNSFCPSSCRNWSVVW